VPTRDWKQFTPFYFYTAVAVSMGGAATVSEARSVAGTFLLLVSGFLSWGVVEYGLHRFAFHHRALPAARGRFFSASHQAHHDRPQATDQLFSSLRMSAPVALLYCLLAWAALGSWQAMAYLFDGLILGYFSYEWLHYQAHHGAPRLRPLKYLRKYHLLHHHRTPEQRFGVTSPVVDYLCGTFRPVGRRDHGAPEHLS